MKVPPPPPSGPRYLVCHLPGFRLERCGWDARQPVVLVAEQKSALRVQACTARAAQAGVRPGLTLAAARALLPELAVELLEPDEEALDLAELSWQLSRFAPAVAPLPPDALVAELVSPRGGVAPAEDALLVAAAQRLRLLGHTARLVIADDLFAARVLAAWSSRDVVVPPASSACWRISACAASGSWSRCLPPSSQGASGPRRCACAAWPWGGWAACPWRRASARSSSTSTGISPRRWPPSSRCCSCSTASAVSCARASSSGPRGW